MRHNRKKPQNRHLARRDRELIYGLHSATAALRNRNREVRAVWTTRNVAARLETVLAERKITPDILHPRDIDRKAGPNAVHQGIVIEVSPLSAPNLDDLPVEGPIVVLDQVTDPHNVGAILRSCAAFNVPALVTTARHSPEGSSVMAKAASGALEHVAIIKVTNLARGLETLAAKGFSLIGLDSDADSRLEDMALPGPYAIVLGAEGKGLRQLTRTKCNLMARLDLPGSLVSLNVSNAAALALYCLSGKK
jgi:23S rRNA (guanosine2251-2'-O)-methyltransferase